mmetsp:Transcript_60861/g.166826  ORF Transcript_60861/g.166826 Transcript_60861/m.166826 type:complete len:297 (+) Transcript_60861:304-1194(+)
MRSRSEVSEVPLEAKIEALGIVLALALLLLLLPVLLLVLEEARQGVLAVRGDRDRLEPLDLGGDLGEHLVVVDRVREHVLVVLEVLDVLRARDLVARRRLLEHLALYLEEMACSDDAERDRLDRDRVDALARVRQVEYLWQGVEGVVEAVRGALFAVARELALLVEEHQALVGDRARRWVEGRRQLGQLVHVDVGEPKFLGVILVDGETAGHEREKNLADGGVDVPLARDAQHIGDGLVHFGVLGHLSGVLLDGPQAVALRLAARRLVHFVITEAQAALVLGHVRILDHDADAEGV